MGTLTLMQRESKRVWGPFEKTITIGRDEQCDLVLPTRMVSKFHCKLEPGDDQWTLVDLGSTNGTFIDAERVSRASVSDGKEIVVGDLVLTLSILPATDRPASRPGTLSNSPAIASASASLWEQATSPVATVPARNKASGVNTRSLRSLVTSSRATAVAAAVVFALIVCTGWSAWCTFGRGFEKPPAPRQLAPIDADPAV